MRVDLDVADGPHFTADICILGAGIAGLTLAHRLSSSGLNVALLEGGGLTPEERSQELYNVEMAGRLHHGVTSGRFRLFGGSSTQWGGQLLAYPDDVFNPPAGLNMQNWPVQSPELEPYYSEILQTFGVPAEAFQTGSVASAGAAPPSSSADVAIRFSRWAPFTQRNLAATLGKQCLANPAIHVYLHANVTRLERDPSGSRIALVHGTSFSGKLFTFSAPTVVVCLGVIESTRLLLASGIDSDPVGRYFHDHIGVHAATLQSPARETAIRLFAPRVRGAVLYTPKLEATAKWRAENGAQAVMAHFPIVEPEDSAVATIRMLLQAVQKKQWPDGWLRRVATLPAGMTDLARIAYSSQIRKRRALSKHAEYRLNIDVEQLPLPTSRITLSNSQKDRFGVPRARLDWKISESEGRTAGGQHRSHSDESCPGTRK
jgi:choline dehydrogenase-like flavoprotein